MSTTAATLAIKHHNAGTVRNPYLPGSTDYAAYERMVEHKQGAVPGIKQ